ncbi:hypothetical protein HMI54_008607 [Coelomomyces lativittatus]|nr:hypothetical protein HMI55_006124 [Coelomomyces lativittatus]KAJ1513801.1 hypothetical protein HMI56_001753 [Coelomomyces lativittatus]KAJ1518750.1 hypothetical protein HMI54_008607 [Coelomomyces lativittatus]
MDLALDTVRRRTRRFSENFRRSPLREPRTSNIDDHPAPISLVLDGNELIYEDGMWVAGNMEGMQLKEQLHVLTEKNQQLQEENQLLKFKLELLMDMLSVTKLDLLRLQETQKSSNFN